MLKMVNYLFNQTGALIAVSGEIATNQVKVHPIIEVFTPTNSMVLADLTLGASAGGTAGSDLAAKSAGTGAHYESIDPSTGDVIVEIKPAAGGFRWETTAVPASPVQVFGFAVTVDDVDDLPVLIGVQSLPAPVTLSEGNQSLTAYGLKFRIPRTGV